MRIFYSGNVPQIVQGKYLYLDNDFISQLFHDEEILKEALDILKSGSFIIDSLTVLEFLRDVFLPQQFNTKKSFISSEIFLPASDHPDIYKHLQENALLLSRIYCHQNQKTKSSLVDLFLAARLVYSQTPLLITGNKKDFPSCVFDTVSVLNIEQPGDGTMRAFSIIKFNQSNFNKCFTALQKLP